MENSGTHSRDNLTAAASLRTERRGLRKTETRTSSIFCGVRAHLGHPVGFFFRADPVSSKFLIQVFIACFEGTWPWRPKLKKNVGTPSAHLPNYHCFCKTFLWRKHAVDRSTVPWLLDGKVVCSSRLSEQLRAVDLSWNTWILQLIHYWIVYCYFYLHQCRDWLGGSITKQVYIT